MLVFLDSNKSVLTECFMEVISNTTSPYLTSSFGLADAGVLCPAAGLTVVMKKRGAECFKTYLVALWNKECCIILFFQMCCLIEAWRSCRSLRNQRPLGVWHLWKIMLVGLLEWMGCNAGTCLVKLLCVALPRSFTLSLGLLWAWLSYVKVENDFMIRKSLQLQLKR